MQKTHSSGPARACDPTLDMAITGLMAALVFTGTYFFKIPTAFGLSLIHILADGRSLSWTMSFKIMES